jgi:hypothetical protein
MRGKIIIGLTAKSRNVIITYIMCKIWTKSLHSTLMFFILHGMCQTLRQESIVDIFFILPLETFQETHQRD